MGIYLYTEDRMHRRTDAGPDVSERLLRVHEKAPLHGHLWAISPYGDTMLNSTQMKLIQGELRKIGETHPELGDDVDSLIDLLESRIRAHGYLWISRD